MFCGKNIAEIRTPIWMKCYNGLPQIRAGLWILLVPAELVLSKPFPPPHGPINHSSTAATANRAVHLRLKCQAKSFLAAHHQSRITRSAHARHAQLQPPGQPAVTAREQQV
ncbi:hypothetical protein GJAV_G00157810 [Gymnothorax javanicus]|nr:hypothetical protein GJAV_G00157810 [Gymnothorax javanicus]